MFAALIGPLHCRVGLEVSFVEDRLRVLTMRREVINPFAEHGVDLGEYLLFPCNPVDNFELSFVDRIL